MFLRSYGDTDFITGLRALAALMVVAVHTRAFDGFGWVGKMVTDNCKYGVPIFFIISGYTIVATYRTSDGFTPYFLRRVMRIVPLYYVAIIAYFIMIATGYMGQPYFMTLYDSQPDAYNLLSHLSFLSAWDARVANSLIGVEWTVPIEMYWYALMPLLLVYRFEWRSFVTVFLLLLLLSGLGRAVAALWLPKHAGHFMPTTYGAYFMLGAWCHHMREKFMQDPGFARLKWLYIGYGSFVLALFTDTGFSAVFTAIAVATTLISYRVGEGRLQVLCSKLFILIGSVSYSFYLWHLLIVFLLATYLGAGYGELPGVAKFVLVTICTLALACLSYAVIEYPTNRWGIRLAKRVTAARSKAVI